MTAFKHKFGVSDDPLAAVSVIPGLANNTYGYNGISYAHNVTSWGGYQYVAWVGSDLYIRISRRTIGRDDWATYSMQSSTGLLAAKMNLDNHNMLAIVADSTGVLHLWGNMHGDWMKYSKTTAPGAYTTWASATMIVVPANKSGTEEGLVSYPWPFVRPTDGRLFFIYRNGGSGSALTFLNSYDTATGTWSRVAKVADGTTGESTYSLYVISPVFDAAGTLHLFGLWALAGSSFNTDRIDLSYIKSTDGGTTWTSASGSPVALPVTPDTMPVALNTPNSLTGLALSAGVAFDANGYPHASCLYTPDPDGNINVWHVRWDGSAWQSEQVTNFAGSGVAWDTLPPQPATVYADGRIFVLWTYDLEGWAGKVWATDVTTPDRETFPVADIEHLRRWQPAPDPEALLNGDVVMVMSRCNDDATSPRPDTTGENWAQQPIGVLTIRANRLSKLRNRTDPLWPPSAPGLPTLPSSA